MSSSPPAVTAIDARGMSRRREAALHLRPREPGLVGPPRRGRDRRDRDQLGVQRVGGRRDRQIQPGERAGESRRDHVAGTDAGCRHLPRQHGRPHRVGGDPLRLEAPERRDERRQLAADQARCVDAGLATRRRQPPSPRAGRPPRRASLVRRRRPGRRARATRLATGRRAEPLPRAVGVIDRGDDQEHAGRGAADRGEQAVVGDPPPSAPAWTAQTRASPIRIRRTAAATRSVRPTVAATPCCRAVFAIRPGTM